MKTFDYAGKTWEYDDNTIFLMELGRYQNKYKSDKTFPCSFLNDAVASAIATYETFNVSLGYKKRLVMVKDGVRTTITHQTTKRNIE